METRFLEMHTLIFIFYFDVCFLVILILIVIYIKKKDAAFDLSFLNKTKKIKKKVYKTQFLHFPTKINAKNNVKIIFFE